ncbi:MAG: hypothetical protein PUI85_02995 [Eubacteriales bacterium]|nr:hypothetical protein [Eubacteriales bacterium]MDY3333166.1 hypothetical protein [Gallibacter sp.]
MVKARRLFTVLIVMMMTIAAIVPYTAQAVDYKEEDYKEIYNAETATLSGMPVYMSGTINKVNDELTFTFYDTTAQVYGPTVKSVNGVLADVELIKGHDYRIFLEDAKYIVQNPNKAAGNSMYIMLDESGNKAISAKRIGLQNQKPMEAIYVKEKAKGEDNRVETSTEVMDFGFEDLTDTKVLFTSEFETVEGKIEDEWGTVTVKLMESVNYIVSLVDDNYTTAVYPVTVKDHSEKGVLKRLYQHFSCAEAKKIIASSEGKIFVYPRVKPQYISAGIQKPELLKMTDINSVQKNAANESIVTVKGVHVQDKDITDEDAKLILNARPLGKGSLDNMGQRDYTVLDIDLINMYRTEICKVVAGDYTIIANVPEAQGKEVKAVWEADSNGKLKPVKFFEQAGGKITIKTDSLSIYNTVIEFKTDIYVPTEESKDQTWSKDAEVGPKFTFKLEGEDGSDNAPKANVDELEAVRIDNNQDPLKTTDYDKRQGSVIVELTKAYADKLTPGAHKLTAVFKGGKEVTVNFNVKEKKIEAEQNQGENNNSSIDNNVVDNNKSVNDNSNNKEIAKVNNVKNIKNNAKVIKAQSVSTSDTFNLGMYIIVGFIALGSIGFIVIKRREI